MRYTKQLVLLVGALCVLVLVAANTLATDTSPAQPAQQVIAAEAAQQAAVLTAAQRDDLDRFARIDSLRVDGNGAPAQLFGELGTFATPNAASALAFLETLRPLLRSGGADSYIHVGTELDAIGQAHYRFQQHLNGMPVLGAMMIVHVEQASGRVLGVNGHVVGDSPADTVPAMGAVEALDAAVDEARLGAQGTTLPNGQAFGRDAASRQAAVSRLDDPTLMYVLTKEGEARLVWRATFAADTPDGHERGVIYADAASGDLVLHQREIYEARRREVYDFGVQSWKKVPIEPGTLVVKEGANLSSITDVIAKDVYQKLGTIYSYLSNRHGRDSFDGKGATLKASVHCTYPANIFWDEGHRTAFFRDAYSDSISSHGTPSGALDTVAHELGHGVTLSSATLIYAGESGRLHEAYSDIFGAAVEAFSKGYNGGADPTSALHLAIWSIGDEWWTPGDPSKALRSLRMPKSCDDPDRNWYHFDYYSEPGFSESEVHLGSTVASLAFHLLAEGGYHPRLMSKIGVGAIGIQKAEKIFFRALTTYLTPFATFADARLSTVQAARDLYGSTSSEQAQVSKCWDAVGVPNAFSPDPSQVTFLSNGGSMDPSLDRPGWQYVALTVPSGQGKLEVVASNAAGWGSGNADIYLKRALAPTETNYDRASRGLGISKTIRINKPQQGTWYAGVRVRDPYGFSRVLMRYSYSSGQTTLYESEGSQGNNSVASANAVTSSNSIVKGRLWRNVDPVTSEVTADEDFFRVTVPAGRTAFITMTSPRRYLYVTELLDANGEPITTAETLAGGSGKFETIAYNNPGQTAKTVYVRVAADDLWVWSMPSTVIFKYVDPNQYYTLDVTW